MFLRKNVKSLKSQRNPRTISTPLPLIKVSFMQIFKVYFLYLSVLNLATECKTKSFFDSTVEFSKTRVCSPIYTKSFTLKQCTNMFTQSSNLRSYWTKVPGSKHEEMIDIRL